MPRAAAFASSNGRFRTSARPVDPSAQRGATALANGARDCVPASWSGSSSALHEAAEPEPMVQGRLTGERPSGNATGPWRTPHDQPRTGPAMGDAWMKKSDLATHAATTVFVDGNNVMGSRADGWWRNAARPRFGSLATSHRSCVPGAASGPSFSMGLDCLPAAIRLRRRGARGAPPPECSRRPHR